MKTCTDCGVDKPFSDFYKLATGKFGLNPRCKPCVNARNRQWAAENNEKVKAYSRQWARRRGDWKGRIQDPAKRRADHYRRTYGLSAEESAMFEARLHGPCDVCGRLETMLHGSAGAHLSVDHDHATHKVRGLLCFACNRALGCMRDDPVLIRRLAEYVENPPHSSGGEPIKYTTFKMGLPEVPVRPKTGWHQSEEAKTRISAAQKGIAHTIGAKHPPRSPEWLAKQSEAQRVAWARRKAGGTSPDS